MPKHGQFSVIPSRAYYDTRLTSDDRDVLAVVGIFADKNGWCFPKQSTISSIIGKSRSFVSLRIKHLVECGYMTSTVWFNEDDHSQTSNRYRILYDGILPDEFDRVNQACHVTPPVTDHTGDVTPPVLNHTQTVTPPVLNHTQTVTHNAPLNAPLNVYTQSSENDPAESMQSNGSNAVSNVTNDDGTMVINNKKVLPLDEEIDFAKKTSKENRRISKEDWLGGRGMNVLAACKPRRKGVSDPWEQAQQEEKEWAARLASIGLRGTYTIESMDSLPGAVRRDWYYRGKQLNDDIVSGKVKREQVLSALEYFDGSGGKYYDTWDTLPTPNKVLKDVMARIIQQETKRRRGNEDSDAYVRAALSRM